MITEAQIVKRPFAFRWLVPKAGVSWRADVVVPPDQDPGPGPGPGPWLIAERPAGEEVRLYAPLDRRRLHRQFAALNSDAEIEHFASRFGLLNGYSEVVAVAGILRSAESHALWTREIAAMRGIVQAWDVVRSRSWDGRGVINPDRLRVYKTVNGRLEGHMSSVAHPYRGGEILHWPDSLLSALYLLLQLELAYRPARSVSCKQCGRVIEGVGNSRRQFCDANCRTLHHYHHRLNRPAREP